MNTFYIILNNRRCMITISQGGNTRAEHYVIPLQMLDNTAICLKFQGLKVHQPLESINPNTL